MESMHLGMDGTGRGRTHLEKGQFCPPQNLIPDPDGPNPRLFEPKIGPKSSGRGHCRLPANSRQVPRPWWGVKKPFPPPTPLAPSTPGLHGVVKEFALGKGGWGRVRTFLYLSQRCSCLLYAPGLSEVELRTFARLPKDSVQRLTAFFPPKSLRVQLQRDLDGEGGGCGGKRGKEKFCTSSSFPPLPPPPPAWHKLFLLLWLAFIYLFI